MNLSSQCPLAHSFCFKDQRITEQFQLEETSQISWFHPLPWDLSTCSPGLSFTAVGGDHSHPWSCTHLDSCSPKSCQLLGVLGGSPGVSGAQEIPLHATIPPLTLEHSCGSASAVDRSSSQKPPLLSPPHQTLDTQTQRSILRPTPIYSSPDSSWVMSTGFQSLL